MAENIIYCYSGSGHCLNMAKDIAKALGDTDIVMLRKFPVKTDATEAKRVGFVFSCMAGGLPGDMEAYLRHIKIAPDAYVFAVEQFAGYLGCGLHKIDQIFQLDYWTGISNHSTAIWLMPHVLTFPPTSLKTAQKRVDRKAAEIAADILAGRKSGKRPAKAPVFALMSKAMSGSHAKRVQTFHVNSSCIGCGTCAKLCPRENIKLADGKPVFGTNCIGCLSCVQYCPKEAINIGKITEKRARYRNKRIAPDELTKELIHID